MKLQTQFIWLGLLVGGGALASVPAGGFSIPNDFQAGTPARASEVNENFQAVQLELANQALDIEQVANSVPLENLIRVSSSGGDFSSIASALDSIQDASESNRYKVFVGPGVYQETDICIVPSFVTLSGAGKAATVLTTARGGANHTESAAAVRLLDGAVISDLTVRNAGVGASAHIGILGIGVGATTTIQDVRVEVDGNGGDLHVAVQGSEDDWVIEDSDLLASNANSLSIAFESRPELFGVSSSPVLTRCRIEGLADTGTARGLVFNTSRVHVTDCEVIGSSLAVQSSFDGVLFLTNCKLEGVGDAPWASLSGNASALSIQCTFESGNPIGPPNSFLYTWCSIFPGFPVVNGSGSSVE